ncbi:hypothetical protein [Pseudomonas syringae]|uniref:Uncharacterized protein n=9 Tax=Pseudomonas syringae TaxID=317 RepID=A0A9Q4FIQ8_PSESX|nr:hypothetical protein [Pseudomonas syringae]MCF5469017.1 hypothetical protein [Pseudomonas syringae]MCF5471624.1 hypothetical protein [Pseudomonas syringae]MCF5482601.1 hypothetical protein [Pseudomonas syringae]MCF5489122.1 hypothetical protein [Pseudomonas syringae]MCF5491572.1 hypothetical protein [Pseudomonas syringae]
MDFNKWIKRVSSYFALAVLLKISLSIASLKLNDPFWLGLVFPLTVMVAYWVIGYVVREKWDKQLTVAKFADSVYYLGFLFTVASIIICLLDIESMGDNLNGMATRFGAAMVSTALGMLARIIHTGFRIDTNDALRSVEERAINAAENLAISFDNTFQQLEVFRDKVDVASREAVQSVKEQVKALYEHNISATDAYFANATRQSNEAFALILDNTQQSSNNLLSTISEMTEKSALTLRQMEDNALDFGTMARDRVEQMIFPDDLFTRKLGGSIETLAGTTDSVNEGVASLAEGVKTATRQVTTAIRNLNAKTQTLDENLVAVGAIVTSQERLVDAMRLQGKEAMDSVERVQKEYLDSLDEQQEEYLNEIKTRQQLVERIADKLDALNIRIESADTAGRLSSEIADALKGIRDVSQTNRDVLAESLEHSLAPLVQALVESNEKHQGVTARMEQQHLSIETSQSQLAALINKIDTLSTVEKGASTHQGEPESLADARSA